MSYQIPQQLQMLLIDDPDTPLILPEYLLHDIQALEAGRADADSLDVDCLEDELSASLHMAVDDGSLSDEMAFQIRQFYHI